MSLSIRLLFLALLLVVSASLSAHAKVMHPAGRAASQATVVNVTNADGNPVVSQPLSFYFFYYGDFSANRPEDQYTPALIKQFVTDISDTTYMNILTQYTGTNGVKATTTTGYAGQTFITGYPNGKVLATQQSNCFETLLHKWIKQYNVVVNTNTQYYIVYSSDVTYQLGVCESKPYACGYHTSYEDKPNNRQILWGQVGSSDDCANPDGPYTTATNSAIDTLSHEIFETISDPYLDAWNDADGNEIGDKCSDYGTTHSSNFRKGAKYNLLLNGHEYLVQTEWSNEQGGCVLSRGVAPSSAVSPSALASVSQSISPAASSSVKTSSSNSPSPATVSNSVSGSASPATVSNSVSPVSASGSGSGSVAASISKGASRPVSPSISISPSVPASPSWSPSISISPSVPASPSLSSSISISPSWSPSTSISPSWSLSTSYSPSPVSISGSSSVSVSGSISNSAPKVKTPSSSVKATGTPVGGLPSADPSRSKGASASRSAPVAASRSLSASPSVQASVNLAAGACFDCPNFHCDYIRSVAKVCTRKLQGNFTEVNGVACCKQIKVSSYSFSWIQARDALCDYPLTLTKKYRLCNALGGTVSCKSATGNVKGLKLTCSR